MSLELPPLRERSEDIPLLLNHFLGSDWEIEDDAMRAMEHYHWPGNIRQLINAIERAKIMADEGQVRLRDLPREVTQGRTRDPLLACLDTDDLSYIERTKVVEVMRRERGNKTRAAHALGIDRRKLYRLIEKYDIQESEFHETQQ
jgi:DNA-binding NtrC family response regulator